MGDQERKIQEIGLWWGECEGVDWRALWSLGVVNGLGSYEVKVSSEGSCEVMVDGHSEGVVVVY